MSSVESISRAPSIVPTATSGSVFRPSWQWILEQARQTWPDKTAETLADISGAGVRTCFRWLSGKARPSADRTLKVLAALRAELARRQALLQQFELDLR